MAVLSTTENKILMAEARESLHGVWGLAVGTFLVYFIIIAFIQMVPKIGDLIYLILGGPFTLGIAIFTLSISRRQHPQLSQIFEGFQRFKIAFLTYILQTLFILLWMLLLIIPGIIAALSYAMTFYIIAEDDSIQPMEALAKSKEMMNGNRWKLFCLGLRFLGWALLCILTLGIGFLWLIPYISVSYAKFYEDLLEPSDEEESEIS